MTDEELAGDILGQEAFSRAVLAAPPDRGLGRPMDVATFLTRNGLFHAEARRARSYLQSVRGTWPRLPPVHFGWLDDSWVNAVAFRHEGQYFIGVSSAAGILLETLFNRMLSHPDVLSEVGRADAEDASRVAPCLLTKDKPPEVWLPDAAPVSPNDPERRRYALHLFRRCMDFLVGHEFTHVLHGHVDYYDRLGIPSLAEFAKEAGEDIPRLTVQTIEYDADCGAACRNIAGIRDRLTVPAVKPAPPWDRYYVHPTRSLFDWSFAVSAFFRVFGDGSLEGEDGASLSYPPWRVRQRVALTVAESYLIRRWDPALSDTCAPAMLDALLKAEIAFEMVTGAPRSVTGLEHTWGGAGWEHTRNVLQSHWKAELRAELLPLAFTDHLPE